MVTSYHPTITFGEVIGEVLLNTYHAFSPLSVGLSDLLGEYVRSFSKNYFFRPTATTLLSQPTAIPNGAYSQSEQDGLPFPLDIYLIKSGAPDTISLSQSDVSLIRASSHDGFALIEKSGAQGAKPAPQIS
jgi:hypothetical protein